MAIQFLGLTIGDDGTGFSIPTYSQWRDALSSKIRELRGIANLNTNPGSLFGDFIDEMVTALDLACQAASEAVSRTVFSAMGGLALDQFLADILTRVQATPSRATLYIYGSVGAAVPVSTAVRAGPTSTAFLTSAPVVIPALPAEAYGIEITGFAAGAYQGITFTVTVDGVPISYGPCSNLDTGATVAAGLITAINLSPGLTEVADNGGVNPTNQRPTLIVFEDQGGGPFPLTVGQSGGVAAIFAFPATTVQATTGAVTGPTTANEASLRIGPPFAGIQGYTNIDSAIPGLTRETDSQFKARHQITQRGLGGGSPDAIRGVMLSPPEIGGGGLTFCSVEYNPTDAVDAAGNLPHSVRVVANADADPQTLGRALWRAKAAGDNTNGPNAVVIQDQQGNNQVVRYDVLVDRWVGVTMTITPGPDWPNTGDPLSQLRQDVVDYINALQPTGASYGVRVNQLPISLFPNGTPRGVANFTVQLGASFVQGGPYNNPLLQVYPTVQPDAEVASLLFTSRQKARAQLIDVTAILVP